MKFTVRSKCEPQHCVIALVYNMVQIGHVQVIWMHYYKEKWLEAFLFKWIYSLFYLKQYQGNIYTNSIAGTHYHFISFFMRNSSTPIGLDWTVLDSNTCPSKYRLRKSDSLLSLRNVHAPCNATDRPEYLVHVVGRHPKKQANIPTYLCGKGWFSKPISGHGKKEGLSILTKFSTEF